MWAHAGITTGSIVPHSSRARCKPDIEGVEKHPVRVIRIHCDSLVVPVLRVIAGAVIAVSERAALRALHITPTPATVRGSPGTELAAIGAAATVAIRRDGLALCVNVIWVARRDANVNSPELVAGVDVNKRRTAAGVHGRPCRV